MTPADERVAGPLQPLRGNAPLSLRAHDGAVWIVVKGAVDLFSVDFVEGCLSGARTHLLRVEPRDIFVAPSAAAWPENLDVLAVGTADASVVEVHRNWLSTHMDALRRWGESLVHAAAGAVDVSVEGWRQALEVDGNGRSREMGAEAWSAALDSLQVRALQQFALMRLDRLQYDQIQLQSRATFDAQRMQGALTQLAHVLSPRAPLSDVDEAPTDPPLIAACRLVVAHLGIELPGTAESGGSASEPLQESPLELRDPVAEVARAWRIRMRTVVLSDEWFRHDCGPLVAFMAEDGRPVALIPRTPRAYQLIDVTRNKFKLVDATVAATLRPQAFIFYRRLPDHPIGLRDLIRFALFGNRRDVFVMLLTLVAGGLLGTVVPIVTGILVGSVIPGADRPQLWQLVAALAWALFAAAMFFFVQSIAITRIEQNMEAPLQAAVWDRLLNLPANFFRRFTAGDLANRAMGISTLRRALTGAALSSILSVLMSFFNLCLLLWYDARLALVALGLLAILATFTAVALRLQIRRQREVTEVAGKLSGLLLQFFSGISKLRVAGVEDRAFGVWSRQFARQSELTCESRRIATAMAAFDAVFGIVASMALFATVAFGGVAVSTGTFLAFAAAFGSFLAAFTAMNGAIATVVNAIPAYERSQPILHAVPEVEHVKVRVPVLKGEVEVSHVSFRYRVTPVDEGDNEAEQVSPPILDDVSIHAAPGEFIAIVGPSGAGKSTIFRLLLGFEQPDNGAIHFDGESLRLLDVQAVRSQIGVVLQGGVLMSGDIFSNIVGARNLTLDQAWRAAEMAGVADEIRQMPMGMQTFVSEGGGNISGGQRQRLLIARAVVGNPRILLFDEATSAIDNATQAQVSVALQQLNATRVVIAHRLSTVQHANRIYMLGGGRVLEQGTFDELMAEHGAFFRLVQRQLA